MSVPALRFARQFCLSFICAFTCLASTTFADEILVCSLVNSSIQRFDATTGDYLGPLVSELHGGVLRPHSMIMGPDQTIYCASFSNSSVIRFDARTGRYIETFVKEGSGGLDGATEVLFGPDGNLYVASFRTASVLRYDGRTGDFIDTFVPPMTGGMRHPELMTFGPNGDLFVTSMSTHEVLRFDGETGAFLGAFIPARFGGIHKPHAVMFHDGICYVSSFETATVHRFDARTGAPIDLFIRPGDGGLARAHGMAIGPDGNFYICSFRGDQVLKYDGQTGEYLGPAIKNIRNAVDGPTVIFFTKNLRPRLQRVLPGRGGESNRAVVTDVTPGHRVIFAYSNRRGKTSHPTCGGVFLDLARPRVLGATVADATGRATIHFFIDPNATGQLIALQAIDAAACVKTNPVVQRIQ